VAHCKDGLSKRGKTGSLPCVCKHIPECPATEACTTHQVTLNVLRTFCAYSRGPRITPQMVTWRTVCSVMLQTKRGVLIAPQAPLPHVLQKNYPLLRIPTSHFTQKSVHRHTCGLLQPLTPFLKEKGPPKRFGSRHSMQPRRKLTTKPTLSSPACLRSRPAWHMFEGRSQSPTPASLNFTGAGMKNGRPLHTSRLSCVRRALIFLSVHSKNSACAA
jgi:hypothetical protein